MFEIWNWNSKTAAKPTPGTSSADDFLRAVTPEDIDRLMARPDDPRDRDFGVSTHGGGVSGSGGGMDYPSHGYNTPNRHYPSEPGDPGYQEPGEGGYHMPGITHPYDDDDEDEPREPAEYHVMTGHVDEHDPRNWTEHEYTMFEHPDADYDTDSAWDFFQQDHPEYNPERNIHAEHEVKHVHPAEEHYPFHKNLSDERETFENRIAPTGLRRESPEVPGHRAYRHEEPSGLVHRLWRSSFPGVNGPGWNTSRHDPAGTNDRTLLSEHLDSVSDDSLGDALARVKHNRGD